MRPTHGRITALSVTLSCPHLLISSRRKRPTGCRPIVSAAAHFAWGGKIEQKRNVTLLPLSLSLSFSPPLNAAGLPAPFTGPIDLRRALASHADLLSPPRKGALAALAAAASRPEEAARLRLLASAGGKTEFALFVTEPQRSLLEVMAEFPSAVPTLGSFFAAVAPRLAPRFYSISSSPRLHPASVHVTAAVVRGETPTGRVHEGVCTTWLSRIQSGERTSARHTPHTRAGSRAARRCLLSPCWQRHVNIAWRCSAYSLQRRWPYRSCGCMFIPPPSLPPAGPKVAPAVPVYLRSSQFRLPQDLSRPVVMVGPGTGLAPFRGFLQDRAGCLKAGAAALGPAVLFFGCRSQKTDYLYREELEGAVKGGALTALHVAFSRDNGKKARAGLGGSGA